MNKPDNVLITLILAATLVMLSGIGSCYHTQRNAFTNGYCEAQGYGTTTTRWVKCSDPR